MTLSSEPRRGTHSSIWSAMRMSVSLPSSRGISFLFRCFQLLPYQGAGFRVGKETWRAGERRVCSSRERVSRSALLLLSCQSMLLKVLMRCAGRCCVRYVKLSFQPNSYLPGLKQSGKRAQSWYMYSIQFWQVSRTSPVSTSKAMQPREKTTDLLQVLLTSTSGAEQQKSIDYCDSPRMPSSQTMTGFQARMNRESVRTCRKDSPCLQARILNSPRSCLKMSILRWRGSQGLRTKGSRFQSTGSQTKKNLLFSLRISSSEPRTGWRLDLSRATCLELKTCFQERGRQAFLISTGRLSEAVPSKYVLRGCLQMRFSTVYVSIIVQMIKQVTVPEAKLLIETDKALRITAAMVLRQSFDSRRALSQEQMIEGMDQLVSIHLQWLGISRIQNLEPFCKVRVLYLQCNKIQRIEGLDNLLFLEYLALNDNLISAVENLATLAHLAGLNLATNRLAALPTQQLPKTLQYLRASGNPVTAYQRDVIMGLPLLVSLDGSEVGIERRLEVRGIKMPHGEYRRKYLAFLRSKEKAYEVVGEDDDIVAARQQLRNYTYQTIAQSKSAHDAQLLSIQVKFQLKLSKLKALRPVQEQGLPSIDQQPNEHLQQDT